MTHVSPATTTPSLTTNRLMSPLELVRVSVGRHPNPNDLCRNAAGGILGYALM